MLNYVARLSLLVGTVTMTALTGCSSEPRPRTQLDSISLGRNAQNEACTANRAWGDAGAKDLFDSAYRITCRNVTASRPLGSMRVVADTPQALAAVDALFDCGADAAVTVASMPARARRCTDKELGLETVRVDVPMGKTRLVANATPSLVGPLEQALQC